MASRVSQITHAAVEKLLNDGYAIISFSHSSIPGTTQGWERFLAMSQEQKDAHTIDAEGDGDPDDGYIRRWGECRPNGGYDDDKELFHYRHRLVPRLARKGISIDPHRTWIENSLHQLHLQCESTARMIASALDYRITGYDFAGRVAAPQARTISVLRLLSYNLLQKARPGKIIGKGHTDKSFLTIHVADALPGLMIRASPQPYQARRNTALIFFGDKAQRLTNGRCQALWHEVRDTAENPAATPTRWAIVYFSHIIER